MTARKNRATTEERSFEARTLAKKAFLVITFSSGLAPSCFAEGIPTDFAPGPARADREIDRPRPLPAEPARPTAEDLTRRAQQLKEQRAQVLLRRRQRAVRSALARRRLSI